MINRNICKRCVKAPYRSSTDMYATAGGKAPYESRRPYEVRRGTAIGLADMTQELLCGGCARLEPKSNKCQDSGADDIISDDIIS